MPFSTFPTRATSSIHIKLAYLTLTYIIYARTNLHPTTHVRSLLERQENPTCHWSGLLRGIAACPALPLSLLYHRSSHHAVQHVHAQAQTLRHRRTHGCLLRLVDTRNLVVSIRLRGLRHVGLQLLVSLVGLGGALMTLCSRRI